jgi:hypothetical protein
MNLILEERMDNVLFGKSLIPMTLNIKWNA